jgi:hypothetical protein
VKRSRFRHTLRRALRDGGDLLRRRWRDFRAASYLKDWVDMGGLADCRLSP